MNGPDYAFYQEHFGQKLEQAQFESLVRRAAERLRADTLGQCDKAMSEQTIQQVKLCLCAMAEALADAQDGQDRLTAEALGSWSRQFAAPSAGAADGVGRAERLYLADTGLLYRGVRPWKRTV